MLNYKVIVPTLDDWYKVRKLHEIMQTDPNAKVIDCGYEDVKAYFLNSLVSPGSVGLILLEAHDTWGFYEPVGFASLAAVYQPTLTDLGNPGKVRGFIHAAYIRGKIGQENVAYSAGKLLDEGITTWCRNRGCDYVFGIE
jgi:hypothetical protein